MGFACVCAVLPDALGPSGSVTLGPFCPLGETASFEIDAMAGLHALGLPSVSEARPLRLEDIAVLPATAVLAIAEWALEEITAVLGATKPAAPTEGRNDIPEQVVGRSGRRKKHPERVSSDAAVIVAALAGGQRRKAGDLIKSALEERVSQPHAGERVYHAGVVAVAAAVLEAAERADLDTGPCWKRLPDFIQTVTTGSGEGDLILETLRLLAPLRRPSEQAPPSRMALGYQELNDILMARLADGISLTEAAALLGQKPSTITRRLQRKFGLSFSDYAGRLRVEEAKELLRRTRLTVTEVSRRVGIVDPSNLAKLFQRFDGIAPGEYRRRFGGKS